MRRIGTTSGAHLAVTVAGDGPVVLFLHGIGSSRASFEPQVAALSARFLCVCPDAPGYADSADQPMAGLDSYAEAFEDVVIAVGPSSPVAVVGVSFGGVIATRIVRRGRIDVGALVLADTSPGSGIDAERARAMRHRADELARLGADSFAAARAGHLVSASAAPSLVERVRSAMAASIRLPGYRDAAAAMAATDLRDEYRHVHCPTLVVVGQHDGVCPPSIARDIADSIGCAEYSEIPDAGHLANQEQPDRFNEIVGAFLTNHLEPSRNGA